MRNQEQKAAATSDATTPATPKKNTRAEQSRINGSRSRGPHSHHGKILSSRNALKHGLTATIHTVLSHESAALCNEVEDAWVNDLRPATKAELRLVQQLANVNWRLERLAMMETSLLNIEMSVHSDDARKAFEFIDEVGILGSAWKASADSSNGLDLLRRYLATLQSQFNNTLKNFRSLEAARKHPSNIRDSVFAEPYAKPRFDNDGTPVSIGEQGQLDEETKEEISRGNEELNVPCATATQEQSRKRKEPENQSQTTDNTITTSHSGSPQNPTPPNQALTLVKPGQHQATRRRLTEHRSL